MTAESSGIDLMTAVEKVLSREVAPGLSGDTRFKVLMAASALRMVMREIAEADALATASARLDAFGSRASLVAALRGGRHDADAALHAALLGDASVRTRVSHPARAEAKDT